jgi:hypothetical protein
MSRRDRRGRLRGGSQDTFEFFRKNAGALELPEQFGQEARKAGRTVQRSVVRKLSGVAQGVHQVSDQPVADGGWEASQALTPALSQYLGKGEGVASQCQHVGVEVVKGLHLDAEGAAGLGQAAAKGRGLDVVRHQDARGGERWQGADGFDEVGGLASTGGGEE